MRLRALSGAGLLTMLLMLSPLVVRAEDQGLDAHATAAPLAQPTDDETIKPEGDPLTPAEDETLSRALLFGTTTTLFADAPAKALKLPGQGKAPGVDINSTDKDDGSGTVNVKRVWSSDLDAKVGADFNVAPPPPETYQPNKPMPGSAAASSNSAAWASLGLDNLASVDARVSQGNDEGKLGTTLQRSVPFGSRFSVTVHDTYSLREAFATQNSAPAGLPIMTLPQQSVSGSTPVYSNDRGVKFNILPTGTTLSAGLANVSNDPITHNSLSADQQVYGPLHVTTSVNDLGTTIESKKITAALKLNW